MESVKGRDEGVADVGRKKGWEDTEKTEQHAEDGVMSNKNCV